MADPIQGTFYDAASGQWRKRKGGDFYNEGASPSGVFSDYTPGKYSQITGADPTSHGGEGSELPGDAGPPGGPQSPPDQPDGGGTSLFDTLTNTVNKRIQDDEWGISKEDQEELSNLTLNRVEKRLKPRYRAITANAMGRGVYYGGPTTSAYGTVEEDFADTVEDVESRIAIDNRARIANERTDAIKTGQSLATALDELGLKGERLELDAVQGANQAELTKQHYDDLEAQREFERNKDIWEGILGGLQDFLPDWMRQGLPEWLKKPPNWWETPTTPPGGEPPPGGGPPGGEPPPGGGPPGGGGPGDGDPPSPGGGEPRIYQPGDERNWNDPNIPFSNEDLELAPRPGLDDQRTYDPDEVTNLDGNLVVPGSPEDTEINAPGGGPGGPHGGFDLGSELFKAFLAGLGRPPTASDLVDFSFNIDDTPGLATGWAAAVRASGNGGLLDSWARTGMTEEQLFGFLRTNDALGALRIMDQAVTDGVITYDEWNDWINGTMTEEQYILAVGGDQGPPVGGAPGSRPGTTTENPNGESLNGPGDTNYTPELEAYDAAFNRYIKNFIGGMIAENMLPVLFGGDAPSMDDWMQSLGQGGVKGFMSTVASGGVKGVLPNSGWLVRGAATTGVSIAMNMLANVIEGALPKFDKKYQGWLYAAQNNPEGEGNLSMERIDEALAFLNHVDESNSPSAGVLISDVNDSFKAHLNFWGYLKERLTFIRNEGNAIRWYERNSKDGPTPIDWVMSSIPRGNAEKKAEVWQFVGQHWGESPDFILREMIKNEIVTPDQLLETLSQATGSKAGDKNYSMGMDINRDGEINFQDFLELSKAFTSPQSVTGKRDFEDEFNPEEDPYYDPSDAGEEGEDGTAADGAGVAIKIVGAGEDGEFAATDEYDDIVSGFSDEDRHLVNLYMVDHQVELGYANLFNTLRKDPQAFLESLKATGTHPVSDWLPGETTTTTPPGETTITGATPPEETTTTTTTSKEDLFSSGSRGETIENVPPPQTLDEALAATDYTPEQIASIKKYAADNPGIEQQIIDGLRNNQDVRQVVDTATTVTPTDVTPQTLSEALSTLSAEDQQYAQSIFNNLSGGSYDEQNTMNNEFMADPQAWVAKQKAKDSLNPEQRTAVDSWFLEQATIQQGTLFDLSEANAEFLKDPAAFADNLLSSAVAKADRGDPRITGTEPEPEADPTEETPPPPETLVERLAAIRGWGWSEGEKDFFTQQLKDNPQLASLMSRDPEGVAAQVRTLYDENLAASAPPAEETLADPAALAAKVKPALTDAEKQTILDKHGLQLALNQNLTDEEFKTLEAAEPQIAGATPPESTVTPGLYSEAEKQTILDKHGLQLALNQNLTDEEFKTLEAAEPQIAGATPPKSTVTPGHYSEADKIELIKRMKAGADDAYIQDRLGALSDQDFNDLEERYGGLEEIRKYNNPQAATPAEEPAQITGAEPQAELEVAPEDRTPKSYEPVYAGDSGDAQAKVRTMLGLPETAPVTDQHIATLKNYGVFIMRNGIMDDDDLVSIRQYLGLNEGQTVSMGMLQDLTQANRLLFIT